MADFEASLSGDVESTSEIPFLTYVFSNPDGKNGEGQYLAGSLSGALSS